MLTHQRCLVRNTRATGPAQGVRGNAEARVFSCQSLSSEFQYVTLCCFTKALFLAAAKDGMRRLRERFAGKKRKLRQQTSAPSELVLGKLSAVWPVALSPALPLFRLLHCLRERSHYTCFPILEEFTG